MLRDLLMVSTLHLRQLELALCAAAQLGSAGIVVTETGTLQAASTLVQGGPTSLRSTLLKLVQKYPALSQGPGPKQVLDWLGVCMHWSL